MASLNSLHVETNCWNGAMEKARLREGILVRRCYNLLDLLYGELAALELQNQRWQGWAQPERLPQALSGATSSRHFAGLSWLYPFQLPYPKKGNGQLPCCSIGKSEGEPWLMEEIRLALRWNSSPH